MQLILASASPRRKQLLTQFGFKFKVESSNFSEEENQEDCVQLVKKNAYGKAKEVFDRLGGDIVVLGADTIVCFNGKVLGKPKDKTHAVKMLKALSNNTHQVYTGYAIITKEEQYLAVEKSEVVFNDLSQSFIEEYVNSGSPMDKAGGYGIQDNNLLVKEYKGSLNNIIGLPVEVFKEKLESLIKV